MFWRNYNMKRKVLSVLLAVLMITSVFGILASAEYYTDIDYISINGVTAPTVGAQPVYSASENGSDQFRIYTEYIGQTGDEIYDGVSWYDVTDQCIVKKGDVFKANHEYTVSVYLTTKKSSDPNVIYMFPSIIMNIFINGKDALGGYITPSASSYSSGYCVYYTFPALETQVDSITVTGVTAPAKGAKPAYKATVASSEPYTVTQAYDDSNIKNGVEWYDTTAGKQMKSTDTFQAGHAYSVTVYLRVKEDYVFPRNFTGTAKVNGKSATAAPADPLAMADLLQDYSVIYDFPALDEDPVTPAVSFPDVKKGSWYYDSVMYVAQKGYMAGYSNHNFGPADYLQRQDFVLIIARIAGANLDDYADATPKFSDVKKGSYYYAAVMWGVANNVIGGYNNGKFGVGDNINREQVAAILYAYVKPSATGSSAILSTYPDKDRISEYAQPAMIWAVNNGIISGMGDGRIAPKDGASRAQIATIITRMDEQGLFNKA